MSTEDIIIRLFCMVDDRMGVVNKRSDAKLHDSEIVTISMRFSMRSGQYRPFYRWLLANYHHLFPRLPDLTRLLRLFKRCSHYTDEFLAEPSFLPLRTPMVSNLFTHGGKAAARSKLAKKANPMGAGLWGSSWAG